MVKDSTRPITMPPSTAPGIMPMPPSTAETKAFRPSREPMVVYTLGYWAMYISAATAARPEPTAKVSRMVWLTLMPINVAAALSSDTQRMARPSRVFWVNS